MTTKFSLALSHFGFHVTDVAKMVDFYTRFLGFVVSDRGETANGGQIVFMTRDASEHHQLVMATGRPADLSYNVINQMSFRVDSLQTLRKLHAGLHQQKRHTWVAFFAGIPALTRLYAPGL